MMTFDTLNEAFVKQVRLVLEHGQAVAPRGIPTTELLGCALKISNPRARLINNPARKWSIAYAVGELCWHLAGSNDLNQIRYYSDRWDCFSDDRRTVTGSAYGSKIFSKQQGRLSQWDRVRSLLKSDKASRRALITLYHSQDLDASEESKDVPCTSTLQFFLRDNKLDLITSMRSNDVMLGFGYDIFLFTMLQELLSVQLDVGLGSYHHHVGSLHIYSRDKKKARAAIDAFAYAATEMDPLENETEVPLLLEYERDLRNQGCADPTMKFAISKYWQSLLVPLLFLNQKKFGSEDGARKVKRRAIDIFGPLLFG